MNITDNLSEQNRAEQSLSRALVFVQFIEENIASITVVTWITAMIDVSLCLKGVQKI